MRSTPVLLATALILAAAAGPTVAQEAGAPVPIRIDDRLVLPTPAVEVLRGSPVVTAHVVRHGDDLEACAAGGRAATVKAQVKIRWNKRGRTRSVTVKGGTSSFRRCAKKALTGVLPIVRRRAGSGSAAFVVSAPATPDPLALAVDLQSCQVDADCTLHFQLHACVPGDPVAVNTLDPAAIRLAYPVRRLECAMGGPQYEELRLANENRWRAACEQSRCVVR